MIYKPTYQAARIIAPKVEAIFAQHLAAARESGEEDLAPLPSAQIVEAIIDATFWASLRKEEGHSPKISLAFLPPAQAGNPLLFKNRLPLNPSTLVKIAPGVERAGIHLGIWQEEEGGELHIWGTTTSIPNFCFVLDVSEPALLVIKHRRIYGFGKFTNLAVLKGDQIKIVDVNTARVPDCPPMLLSLLDLTAPSYWNDTVNVLIQLAVSMRSHQRGGTLLVVPTGTGNWLQSIIKPIQYGIQPAFGGLSNLLRQDRKEASQIFWQTALKREVDHLAGLTAVDGATIISDEYELLAFGAKIGRAKGKDLVEELSFVEPIAGGGAVLMHPSKVGGTRHLSAAQFIHDQNEAIALVASQDGHFTIYSWSAVQQRVQAHRIDTLLL